ARRRSSKSFLRRVAGRSGPAVPAVGAPHRLRAGPNTPGAIRHLGRDQWHPRGETSKGDDMLELELVGLHSDGEHLTLAGPDGQRYRLLVDDALRAAVRRDRPQLEQIRANGGLRPKEIQARIRAGASAQEVAEAAGLPVEHVQRYEGPVLAERAWVVEQARRFT